VEFGDPHYEPRSATDDAVREDAAQLVGHRGAHEIRDRAEPGGSEPAHVDEHRREHRNRLSERRERAGFARCGKILFGSFRNPIRFVSYSCAPT